MPTLQELIPLASTLPPAELDKFLATFPREEIVRLAQEAAQYKADIRKSRQIQFYEMANPDAIQIHLATEKQVCIRGGNRSSKSDSMLADAVICMTKIVPFSLENIYPKEKIRCPMNVRFTCESRTYWESNIKRKLQWNQWNGEETQGGERGHWGWIPHNFLIKGKWEESWSAQFNTLTLTCGCTLQVMTYEQETDLFTGGSFHRVIHDEPPRRDVYEENLMRVIDTDGQVYTGFTPSNDPAKAQRGAWIYEIFERGEPGPGKDPDVRSIILHTENNKVLSQDSINKSIKNLTPAERETRLHGAFFHLTGRIHPSFTDRPAWWCFGCNEIAFTADSKLCAKCNGDNIVQYNNVVEPFDEAFTWPAIYCIDPHPRKPHMMLWVTVDPSDDLWVVGAMDLDLKPVKLRDKVFDFERNHGLNIAMRLMDPNMGESRAHNAGERGVKVRQEFDAVGIRCAMANDGFTVGKDRLNEYIQPDERTKAPRLHIFSNCQQPIKQLKNYCFDEQTELLTPDGWTNIASIGSFPVATYNPANGIEFQKPFDYIENKYEGPMVQIKSRALDLFVTPEHRMLVKDTSNPDRWGFTRAANLSKYHMVLCAAAITGNSSWRSPFDHLPTLNEEDWAEFIGWYCSEGYSISRNESLVGICQTNQGSMRELRELLDKMPWEFNYIESNRAFVTYDRNLWAFFRPTKGAYNKMLPREIFTMSMEAKRRCLYGLILGDGSMEKNGAFVYSTISPQLAEDVTELMNHLGFATSLEFRQARISYLKNGKEIRGSGLYVIRARKQNKASLRSGDGTAKFENVNDYSGIVRCVSVPNGTLLARRNHRPIITGNCWGEWGTASEAVRDAKGEPVRKNDDYPTQLRYIVLANPTFRGLNVGNRPMRATRLPRPKREQRMADGRN